MVPAVKAGLVVAAGAAGVTGSYFLVTSADPMPNYRLVGELEDSDRNTYNNKMGSSYQHLLVAPGKTETDAVRSWWEWSYRRWQQDSRKQGANLSEEFKDNTKVTEAFSSSTATALNKVCGGLYSSKSASEVTFNGTTSENKDKLGADLLKYCSPVGQRPIAATNDGYADGVVGKTKKDKLASVKNSSNDGFWSVMNRYFSKSSNVPKDEFFKRYTDGDDNNKKLTKSIKDMCGEAYGKNTAETATSDNPKEADVLKYCSLEGK